MQPSLRISSAQAGAGLPEWHENEMLPVSHARYLCTTFRLKHLDIKALTGNAARAQGFCVMLVHRHLQLRVNVDS